MFNEEAPTNSVGTGAETSLPPASEPGVTPLTSKRKRAIQKMKKMIQTSTTYTKIFSEAAASSISTYAFRVGLPSLGDLIVYAKSESEVRKVVRKYIKPPYSEHDVAVERLFPAAVVDFYYKKRMKALKNVKDNIIEQFILQDLKEMLPPNNLSSTEQDNAQAAKQDQAKRAQQAKQDAQKRIALMKQNAQKQLQQKKAELQRGVSNQQRTLQQKAKSGSVDTPAG